MKRILILVNCVLYNRGSEALIRGISYLCKQSKYENILTLVSGEDDFYKTIKIENIDNYQNKNNYKEKSLMKYIVAILKRLHFTKLVNTLKYSKLKNIAKDQDLIIIIGADNFDITYNMQDDLKNLHTYIRKNSKAKMILYDCSIDKRDITKALKDDLENFDAITVRETISQENIKEIAKNKKIYIYPDPAFIMEKECVDLPYIFNNNKGVVGINVSNLITNTEYGSNMNKIIQAYKNLINYILNYTDMNIVFIPHVMNNADLSTLKILYNDYKDNNRIYLIENENLNAKQLKYIISCCSLYVGARTHSTIAAYSTCVPTLVLGYSVKSKGIAKDIFGTYEKFVLPVIEMKSENDLVDGFKWLYNNRKEIRNKLENIMPKYIENVKDTTKMINYFLGEE